MIRRFVLSCKNGFVPWLEVGAMALRVVVVCGQFAAERVRLVVLQVVPLLLGTDGSRRWKERLVDVMHVGAVVVSVVAEHSAAGLAAWAVEVHLMADADPAPCASGEIAVASAFPQEVSEA